MKLFNSHKDEGHLAHSRKEQFGYIIRNNTATLFFSNFIAFAFFIPLIVDIILSLIVYRNMLANADITANQLFSVFLICGLVSIPAVIIMGLGLSGLYNVIKGLVFDSTAKISSFFQGIKSNFRSYFFIHLIFGILIGTLIINIGVFFYIPIGDVAKIIIMIINTLLLFTLIIGKSFNNFEAVVFNNSTYAYLRNGVYLFYKRLPMSLVSLLILLVPVVLILFVPVQWVVFPLGILATFYLSFGALAIFLISLHSFEILFEPEQIKEIYHKGLEDINL